MKSSVLLIHVIASSSVGFVLHAYDAPLGSQTGARCRRVHFKACADFLHEIHRGKALIPAGREGLLMWKTQSSSR